MQANLILKRISLISVLLFLTACGYRLVPVDLLPPVNGSQPGMGSGGTSWGDGAFSSNGERIYFSATNSAGEYIQYSGGPQTGMMMGGSLSCASCHGPTGRGGIHTMHMDVMDAPDIRYSTLTSEEEEHGGEHGEYDLDSFRLAVIGGTHPDGKALNRDMPRWRMSDQDLADLFEFLKTLP